jgi:Transposase DDE domain group 1
LHSARKKQAITRPLRSSIARRFGTDGLLKVFALFAAARAEFRQDGELFLGLLHIAGFDIEFAEVLASSLVIWLQFQRLAAAAVRRSAAESPGTFAGGRRGSGVASAFVAFYNKRGTCEQWIKEGKGAINWTRLSCRTFAANAVRLQLHALAYNLGNFLRTLATIVHPIFITD